RGADGRGLDGGAGPAVSVLSASLCAGIERGRILEPGPQTAGERPRLAGQQAGPALPDPSGHATLAAFARAGSPLLSSPLYTVCGALLVRENLICQGNNNGTNRERIPSSFLQGHTSLGGPK